VAQDRKSRLITTKWSIRNKDIDIEKHYYTNNRIWPGVQPYKTKLQHKNTKDNIGIYSKNYEINKEQHNQTC
jgi:hypothetical protein